MIVSGASSGLGEAVALKFAQERETVVMAARREDKGQSVVQRIEATGGQALFVRIDVTRSAEATACLCSDATRFVNGAGPPGGRRRDIAAPLKSGGDLPLGSSGV